jgi:hypothetical protein
VTEWTVTPGQAAVLTAIVETGTHKGAAKKLGLSVGTVEQHSYTALKRFGGGPSLLMLLAWDRLLRSGGPLPVGHGKGPDMGDTSRAILRLAARPEGTDQHEVVAVLSIVTHTASQRLTQLTRLGHLRRGTGRPYRYYAAGAT